MNVCSQKDTMEAARHDRAPDEWRERQIRVIVPQWNTLEPET